MFQGRFPNGMDFLGWDLTALPNGTIVLAGTNVIGNVDDNKTTLIVSELDTRAGSKNFVQTATSSPTRGSTTAPPPPPRRVAMPATASSSLGPKEDDLYEGPRRSRDPGRRFGRSRRIASATTPIRSCTLSSCA